MEWIKEKPWRAELIHDCDLVCNGKLLVSASKEKPVLGTVTHYGYKKIGRNKVRMCSFYPDISPDKCWIFSRRWLKRIKNQ